MFPFGFGLSYTSFSYGTVTLDSTEIDVDGEVRVMVDITNTGSRPGAEIVQLYIRDLVSTVTRPTRMLRRFARVELESGETRTVNFELTGEDLALVDLHMKRIVEPGEFEIHVGGSSTDTKIAVLTVT